MVLQDEGTIQTRMLNTIDGNLNIGQLNMMQVPSGESEDEDETPLVAKNTTGSMGGSSWEPPSLQNETAEGVSTRQ